MITEEEHLVSLATDLFGAVPWTATELWVKAPTSSLPLAVRRGGAVSLGRYLGRSEAFVKIRPTAHGWIWLPRAIWENEERRRQDADLARKQAARLADEAMFD